VVGRAVVSEDGAEVGHQAEFKSRVRSSRALSTGYKVTVGHWYTWALPGRASIGNCAAAGLVVRCARRWDCTALQGSDFGSV
jgi:hypothetical protein